MAPEDQLHALNRAIGELTGELRGFRRDLTEIREVLSDHAERILQIEREGARKAGLWAGFSAAVGAVGGYIASKLGIPMLK